MKPNLIFLLSHQNIVDKYAMGKYYASTVAACGTGKVSMYYFQSDDHLQTLKTAFNTMNLNITDENLSMYRVWPYMYKRMGKISNETVAKFIRGMLEFFI